MIRRKMMLFALTAGSILLGSSCMFTNWKWWLGAADFGANVTDVLEHFNIVNGY